jgi:hypothetical protein
MGLTFIWLVELPGDVPLHERRLTGAPVADEDELEGGGAVHGVHVSHSLHHSIHKHQPIISTREQRIAQTGAERKDEQGYGIRKCRSKTLTIGTSTPWSWFRPGGRVGSITGNARVLVAWEWE